MNFNSLAELKEFLKNEVIKEIEEKGINPSQLVNTSQKGGTYEHQ